MVPLTINCWPSISGNESYVNIEYECQVDFDLQNIVVAIPCHQPPKVNQVCHLRAFQTLRLLALSMVLFSPGACLISLSHDVCPGHGALNIRCFFHTVAHPSYFLLLLSALQYGSNIQAVLCNMLISRLSRSLRRRWTVTTTTTHGSRRCCGRWTSSTTPTAAAPWSL